MSDPNNTHQENNPVGRFMVAAGAVVVLKGSQKVLLQQRSHELDWHPGEWEIPYGRLDQYEDLETGLRRELKEETGLFELEVGPVLTTWHIYRGSQKAENELIGITYLVTTAQEEIQLSDEHSRYEWVAVDEALERISIEGIARDLKAYQRYLKRNP